MEPEKTGMSVRPMEVRRERALEVTLGMEALPWTVEIWVFLAAVLGREEGSLPTPRSSSFGCSAARIIANASWRLQYLSYLSFGELKNEGITTS